MPKLLLQPLVENAIIYSIEQAEGTGNIFIRASREEGWIVLEVTDNGPGMPGELVQRLNAAGAPLSAKLPSEGSRSGMAIANIRERLALFYKEALFEIESREGIGTRIQVRIKEGDSGHDH